MGLGELPFEISLRDGTSIIIGLLGPDGREELMRFYGALPESDRMVLKDDVTTEGWADRFLRKISNGEVLSLVARRGDQIIAEGSLYRTQYGWMRHVGEIRATIAPPFRRQGLGLSLIALLVRIATDFGIEKLVVQTMESQAGTRQIMEKLGFHAEATLRRHVTDLSGYKRDLILMTCDVSQIWASMEAMLQDYHPHVGE
jgi:RimJ/RimL family protein N-acetyltransferase